MAYIYYQFQYILWVFRDTEYVSWKHSSTKRKYRFKHVKSPIMEDIIDVQKINQAKFDKFFLTTVSSISHKWCRKREYFLFNCRILQDVGVMKQILQKLRGFRCVLVLTKHHTRDFTVAYLISFGCLCLKKVSFQNQAEIIEQ